MKIYMPGSKGLHRVFVQPGNEFPTSDFMTKEGKPILFTVEFKEGMAKVPDNLGRYMLNKKLAQSSPIILPN